LNRSVSQENYLKNSPARVPKGEDPELQMKRLEYFSKAADAISDGDLIDRMIHGWGSISMSAKNRAS
jgi:replication factor C subunit 1